MDSTYPLRVLITGASSGIGFEALKLLLEKGHNIIAPCRNQDTADSTYKKLINNGLNIEKIEDINFPILDLSNLKSVDEFIKRELNKGKALDCLALNAGLQYTGRNEPIWTEQNIELTFAVNHLSHFLLAKNLIPLLEKSYLSRIVITSSEVHNPKSSGGKVGKPARITNLELSKVNDEYFTLDPLNEFNADKAYKDSKLCNILFARKLKSFLSNSNISVLAWAPGLVIPRSNNGFFRYSRKNNEVGQTLFAFLARDILRITETPKKAGKLLYNLCTDKLYTSKEFKFYSNRIIRPGKNKFDEALISEQSLDDKLCDSLWKLSNELICNRLNYK